MSRAVGLAAKAFDFLEMVSTLGTTSVSELAAHANIPRSTAHRIVRDLSERGFFMSPGRGLYSLGPAAWRLGEAASPERMLASFTRPRLAAFSRQERVHAHLGVLTGDMVSYLVCCAAGPHPIAAVENAQLEAYCTGIGKVLLAHEPQAELAPYLDRGGFVALTPRTLTTADALAAELTRVRARGWAIDDEEIVTGLRCVAVPVRDSCGHVLAALSASASCAEMSVTRLDRLRARLEAIGADLVEMLAVHGIDTKLFARSA
jgi:DNA-binding IclR family transcriptional regulator